MELQHHLDFVKIKDYFITYLNKNILEFSTNLGFFKLDDLLALLKTFFKEKDKNYSYLKEWTITTDEILFFWSYIAGFKKILPLLLDNYVEEIFISPNTQVIQIDHFLYGRMKTNILISEKEKENILFRTAMENNLELNQLNPSIKGDLQVLGLFSLRLTGDISPFSYDGTILNIRKINQHKFTLKYLRGLKTLDSQTCAFLRTLITNASNITIIGSPSSGKTTLQNALLRELPSHWRVFSFENTLETTIKSDNFFRYKIFDFLKKNGHSTLGLINQLLHRSPDYVNLGEITTPEEALAWNACMSAGIPIIQTIHSNSDEGLLSRTNSIFNISNDLLASSIPHIVVEVKYFWNNLRKERKLFSISELVLQNKKDLYLERIAKYDIKNKSLLWVKDPVKTQTFQWIQTNRNKSIRKEYIDNCQKYNDI